MTDKPEKKTAEAVAENAEKNAVNAEKRSRLVMTAVFVLTLVILLVALVYSWFTDNISVIGDGMKVKTVTPDGIYLELLDDGGASVDNLDISGLFPGSEKTFSIRLTNIGKEEKTVDVNFNSITGNELLSVVTCTVDGSVVDLNSSTSVCVVSDLTVQPGSVEIECSFSMSEEAGGEYQNLSAGVGGIEVNEKEPESNS